jgi:hypothetical protein
VRLITKVRDIPLLSYYSDPYSDELTPPLFGLSPRAKKGPSEPNFWLELPQARPESDGTDTWLVNLPPTRRQTQVALFVAVALLVGLGATAPFADALRCGGEGVWRWSPTPRYWPMPIGIRRP